MYCSVDQSDPLRIWDEGDDGPSDVVSSPLFDSDGHGKLSVHNGTRSS